MTVTFETTPSFPVYKSVLNYRNSHIFCNIHHILKRNDTSYKFLQVLLLIPTPILIAYLTPFKPGKDISILMRDCQSNYPSSLSTSSFISSNMTKKPASIRLHFAICEEFTITIFTILFSFSPFVHSHYGSPLLYLTRREGNFRLLPSFLFSTDF